MNDKKRIVIVGGTGKMGVWFARYLSRDGMKVTVIGRNREKLAEIREQLGVEVSTSIETVREADVVMLSVPIDSFEEVVRQVKPYITPGQTVFDITSVKVMPVDVMHRYLEGKLVLGAHPVFGPGARDMRNLNWVLTPTNDRESDLALKVEDYLTTRGARVAVMMPAEHDEMMAVILGLSHFIAIVAANTIMEFGKVKPMRSISGSSYKLLHTLTESVISEDPELYASLQMNLPDMTAVHELFRNNLETWVDIVKNRDRQEFVSKMTAIKDRMGELDCDFGQSYENMYKFLENA